MVHLTVTKRTQPTLFQRVAYVYILYIIIIYTLIICVTGGTTLSDGFSSKHVLFMTDFTENGYFKILLKIISGTVRKPYLKKLKQQINKNKIFYNYDFF